jgi:hypothetical protein
MENNSENIDPWYVTGFSEGEAAFTFSRSGIAFALYFSITQRLDSKEILERVQKYFKGIGKIYSRKERLPTNSSGHTKQNAYFRVCKQAELLQIVEHFDKFPLQSKKHEAYLVWRDMVFEKNKYYLNCDSDQFKLFSTKISKLNQKSRAFIKRSKNGKNNSDM